MSMMEDTMDQAPDLIGPVIAYRAWRVADGHLRAMGMFNPTRWVPGEDMHARCLQATRYKDHDAPAGGCECGFYVMHTLDDLLAEPTQVASLRSHYLNRHAVAGQAEVWGSSERHARGRRVEWCRVRALYRTPLAGTVDVDALAEAYGVPVLDDPDGKIGAWREREPEGSGWLTVGHLFGLTTHVHVHIGAAMQDYVDAINRAIKRFADATQLPTDAMHDMADAIGEDPTAPDKPIPGPRKDHLQIADRNRTKGARNG